MPGDCAGAKPADDNANKRIASAPRELPAGAQCGGAGGECAKFGGCADAAFKNARCGEGAKCVRNDKNWWGCKKA